MHDAFAITKQNDVMKDTWGHFYPVPGKKYTGTMLIAVGDYGDQVILKSEFQNLECSPQRYALEHSVFDHTDFDEGIHKVSCTLWFFKKSDDAYLGKPIGKIIKLKYETIKGL